MPQSPAASSNSGPHEQRTRTFYKLTSQQTLFPHDSPMGKWGGIATSGLDPSRAGKNHLGATSSAKSSVARNETELDRNQTWLSQSKSGAYSYRSHIRSSPRMLKIVLPEDWASQHVTDWGNAGFTTDQLIPPDRIRVKTAHGDGGTPSTYTPLTSLQRSHFSSYDSDSGYDSGDDDW